MIDQSIVLEHITVVAPLGLRFWDAVSGGAVSDGLIVTAYPPNSPALRIPLLANRSGIFICRNLPSLRHVENGTGDADFWRTLPPARPFVVEVIDAGQRFLSFTFTVHLPFRPETSTANLPVPDSLLWQCSPIASPLDSSSPVITVPLYSAPARTVPGMAVVRAELQDAVAPQTKTDAPAAWALLEVWLATTGQVLGRGFADERGCVGVIFPYPEPADSAPGSPLGSPPGNGQALARQFWPLQLRASYGRLNPVAPLPELYALPDLCDILSQGTATLWADAAQTQALTEVHLLFGRELVVTSQSPLPPPLSVVLVTPQ